MRKNVEDEELQKIVRILTKSVSLKLNNLWPKKFGYDLGTKAVEFVEGGKCIKGAQPFVESLRDELSGIKHKGRSIKEVDDYEIMFGEDITCVLYTLYIAWYYTRNVVDIDLEFQKELDHGAKDGAQLRLSRDMFERLLGQPIVFPIRYYEPSDDPNSPSYHFCLVGAVSDQDGRLSVYGAIIHYMENFGDGISIPKNFEMVVPLRLAYFDQGEEYIAFRECESRVKNYEENLEVGNEVVITILSSTIYSLCDNDETSLWRSTRYEPAIRKVKKGVKMFPPEQVNLMRVGQDFGDEIRKFYREYPVGKTVTLQSNSNRTVRPHIRRGHWHLYWFGNRSQPDLMYTKLLWISPTFVHSHE